MGVLFGLGAAVLCRSSRRLSRKLGLLADPAPYTSHPQMIELRMDFADWSGDGDANNCERKNNHQGWQKTARGGEGANMTMVRGGFPWRRGMVGVL